MKSFCVVLSLLLSFSALAGRIECTTVETGKDNISKGSVDLIDYNESEMPIFPFSKLIALPFEDSLDKEFKVIVYLSTEMKIRGLKLVQTIKEPQSYEEFFAPGLVIASTNKNSFTTQVGDLGTLTVSCRYVDTPETCN